MKQKLLFLTVLLLLCVGCFRAQAQKVAIKTNLLYGAATFTPNLGLELGLGPRSTLELSGGYNPWNLQGTIDNNNKLVHWLGHVEYRWWNCQKFNGHFLGAHLLGSQYNISGKDIPLLFDNAYRYEGWAAGAGVSWGYHWIMSGRFSMEFTLGAGYAYLEYGRYNCAKCSTLDGNYFKHYVGPTKAGISLIFMIK